MSGFDPVKRIFDIITIADMCVDLIMDLGDVVPRFGQVEQWVPDYFMEMGGSACIFACQAAKLGLRTGIFGRVGPDTPGELMLRRMQESGVDTSMVLTDLSLKTGLGISLCRPDGDRSILTYAGSLNAVYPEDITDEFLLSGRHLHYCSYYLQTNLLPAAPAILQRAKALGLTVSLDTNWDPAATWNGGLRAALGVVDLFFPNEREAMAITGTNTTDAALDALLALSPSRQSPDLVGQNGAPTPELVWGLSVAMKMGEQGAIVANRDTRMLAPVAPVDDLVDTIGAGDSFDAGFLAGWLRGLSLAECAAIGNACGRATTQARGGIMGQPRAPAFPALGSHEGR
jgi:sugar/nucleoside kinase (ribokinase family)